MFLDFLKPYKQLWSMDKKSKGYDHQSANPLLVGLTMVKDSMFLGLSLVKPSFSIPTAF